jgi:hypothetical protein
VIGSLGGETEDVILDAPGHCSFYRLATLDPRPPAIVARVRKRPLCSVPSTSSDRMLLPSTKTLALAFRTSASGANFSC